MVTVVTLVEVTLVVKAKNILPQVFATPPAPRDQALEAESVIDVMFATPKKGRKAR
jgi:hypothetical protein